MTVLDKLANALDRNDEKPNVELAEKLVASGNRKAVAELAAAIETGKSAVQNDAIKVLYEIGERKPGLIAAHADVFLAALKSKNNRLVWGAMSALDTIAAVESKALYARMPEILDAAEKGSVIAKDKAVSLLCKLSAAGHARKTVPVLLEMLKTSAVNQLPMYAEHVAAVVTPEHRAALADVISRRLKTIDQASKRARLDKVLRKLAK
jgi:hypothetical protein